jgi:hypothetical protein
MPLQVMFVTGGLSAPRRDAPVMLAPGRCELKIELFQQVGEAAGAARANFYVIQPGDMMVKGQRRVENIAGVGYLGSDDPIEGIEHLAVYRHRAARLWPVVLPGWRRLLLYRADPAGRPRSGQSGCQ